MLAMGNRSKDAVFANDTERAFNKIYNTVQDMRGALNLSTFFNDFAVGFDGITAGANQAAAATNGLNDALNNIGGSGTPGGSGGSGGSGSPSGGSGSGGGTEKVVEDLEDIRDMFYDIDNALKDVDNSLTLVETKMEHAFGDEYLNLHKQKMQLLQEQGNLLQDQIRAYEDEASRLRDELSSEGFQFDANGSLTNYMAKFDSLRGWANSLVGDEKENAKQHVQDLMDKVNEYTDLIKDQIPQATNEWEDMVNQIKEAERELAETATDSQKEVGDALEHYLDKRYESIKTELEKEKELYEKEYEENEYADSLAEEQRKLDEIQQQINNLMRDTSEAGRLKLEDLKKQYLDQQEAINDMIKEHQKDQISSRFDEEMDNLDKELDDLLTPENLVEMINQGITSGMITIGDEVVELSGVMDTWLNETGDGLYAIGDILRTELCENLLTAKSLLADMGITSLGVQSSATQALASSEGLLARGSLVSSQNVAQSVVFEAPLLTIEGNVSQDTLPEIQTMIKKAQEEVIAKIAKQLNTR